MVVKDANDACIELLPYACDTACLVKVEIALTFLLLRSGGDNGKLANEVPINSLFNRDIIQMMIFVTNDVMIIILTVKYFKAGGAGSNKKRFGGKPC